jgi:hypothetical protein
MPVDANIAMGVRLPEFENPLNNFAKMMAIQNAQNQNALAQYNLSSAQRNDEVQNRFLQDIRGAGEDPSLVKRAFYNAGKPEAYADFQKKQADAVHVAAQTGKLAQEALGLVYGNFLKGNDPLQAAAVGPEGVVQHVTNMYADPTLGPLMSKSKPMDQAIKENLAVYNEKGPQAWAVAHANLTPEMMVKVLSGTPHTQNLGNVSRTTVTDFTGKPVSAPVDAPIAESADAKLRAQSAAATLAETKRHHGVIESQANTGYGQEYGKLTPEQRDAVDWYSKMSLGGDQTWRTGLARTRGGSDLIKAVDERVPQMAAELGLSPADIGTNKAVRVATSSALTQNTKDVATLKPYVEMLHQNVDILSTLADKAIATNSALANKPINWVRQNMGDNPAVADYLAQIEIVKNEATRVISNPRLVGQMTDTARKEIESIINGSMPINSTKTVLARIKNDGDRRINTMLDQQKQLQNTLTEMTPGGKGAAAKDAAATPDAMEAKVKATGQAYEPQKYDYRVAPDGSVQRKLK